MSKVGALPLVGPGPGQMSHCTEQYDVCPYNQSHVILRYRMQTHLHKCRQNYPLDDKVICEFDATHHVPSKELDLHYKTCASRENFLRGRFNVNEQTDSPIAPVRHIDLPEPEENWDDGAVGGYDPKAAAEKKNLIRGIHGAPPSERKQFKLSHRRHLQDLEAEAEANGPIKMPTAPPKISADEPLRLPKEPPQALMRLGRGLRISEPEEERKVEPAPRNPGQWIGRGRGAPTPTPAPAPTVNAWGRGRPQF